MLCCGGASGARVLDFADRAELSGTVSNNGAVTLSWEKDPAVAVEVQQAADERFSSPTTRYTGPDPGTVVTGLPEGMHWFRIRAAGSDTWSPPLPVTVAFFPRWKLFLLLGTGGVVVLATIATIVAGHFRTTRAGKAAS